MGSFDDPSRPIAGKRPPPPLPKDPDGDHGSCAAPVAMGGEVVGQAPTSLWANGRTVNIYGYVWKEGEACVSVCLSSGLEQWALAVVDSGA